MLRLSWYFHRITERILNNMLLWKATCEDLKHSNLIQIWNWPCSDEGVRPDGFQRSFPSKFILCYFIWNTIYKVCQLRAFSKRGREGEAILDILSSVYVFVFLLKNKKERFPKLFFNVKEAGKGFFLFWFLTWTFG